MAKTKSSSKRELPKPDPKSPKPAFNMAEPNDDMAAFGWDLGRLRHPSADSKRGDVWPGRSVFEIEEASQLREAYGFNIDFINAKFLQVMLDSSPAVREAAEKARAARYTKESLAKLEQVILDVYRTDVVPAMTKRLKKIASLVAQFYAARLAHITKFGVED